MVKIKIPLPPNAPFGGEAEWIWADEMENGLYRVKNVPFFARGLAFDDVVNAEMKDGVLIFGDVARHSGHSTYRIFTDKGREQPEVIALLDKLRDMRCNIEGATKKLIAVDVLPDADVYEVYNALEQAEQSGILEFEEGHCGHRLKA